MKNLIFKIAVLTGTVAAFASCSDTWLMYDTSQKDKLYFKYENYPSLDQYLSTDFSFALLDESVKEVKKTVTVTLLGMPADRDRTFEVRAIHDTTSNYTTGGVQRELIDAVENEDYTIDRLIVPAGSVEGQIDVTLKRTEKIMTKTASLVLQIAQNEEFEGVPRNVYRFLISDGTAACPYCGTTPPPSSGISTRANSGRTNTGNCWNSTTESRRATRRSTRRWSNSTARTSTTITTRDSTDSSCA